MEHFFAKYGGCNLSGIIPNFFLPFIELLGSSIISPSSSVRPETGAKYYVRNTAIQDPVLLEQGHRLRLKSLLLYPSLQSWGLRMPHGLTQVTWRHRKWFI